MLWVVYTCVSRSLNQQKMNQLNPITLPRENVQNNILEVFSQQGGLIDLIPFVMGQASPDTSLKYPQHSIPITLKFHFLGG